MAEKSLPNPTSILSFTDEAEEVGVVHVTDVIDACPHEVDELAIVASAALMEEEEEEGEGEWEEGVALPLREGGTMSGVNSLGTSFLRTFSAMRYMARANCSAFSLPFFSMSHKFLQTQSCDNTQNFLSACCLNH